MSNSKAIVTLALGAVYQYRWQRFCRDNWQAYGRRHGYDIICLEAPLDQGPVVRSPTWQKCLVLSQPFARAYERVVWVDADVLFHPDAPCLASQVPAEKIGAVDEYAVFGTTGYQLALSRLYQAWDYLKVPYLPNPTPGEFYTNFGLAPAFDQVVQTGLLVMAPAYHAAILEAAYHVNYSPGLAAAGEMAALSDAILQAGCVAWLDWHYNELFACYLALHAPALLTHPVDREIRKHIARALDEAYCLHLAGMGRYLAAGRAQLDQLVATSQPEVAAPAAEASAAAASISAIARPERPAQSSLAMFLFNRPDTTARVFAAVRRARPARLFLVADGPRPDQPGEAEQCASARAVAEAVDWDCDVRTNYAEANLGLKRRFESGLDWVFGQVETAIVLEDDCVPAPDFFVFCDEMLTRYRDDDRIFSISGNNFQFGRRRGEASYYFSRYPLIWGWATWRRAWRQHDPSLAAWPDVRDAAWLEDFLGDPVAASYWSYLFEKAYQTGHTWDYPWTLTHWLRGGLSIIPAANLVTNIGYGPGATNTRQPDVFANLPLDALTFPLRHPERVERDAEADAFTETVHFSGNLKQLLATARANLRANKAS